MHVLELEGGASSAALERISAKVAGSKKIVFVAGAGISCNAGIPDFRSKDGLYALVKKSFPDTVVKGQDLFDINIFRKPQTTEIFYSFMAGLRTATFEACATPTHHLLKILKDNKKLLRCYTQNIDGLEYRVGLTECDAVQLHGDLHKLRCTNCHELYEWNDVYHNEMLEGSAPACLKCADASFARTVSGKRKTSVGHLRPDIILYGQDHPGGDRIADVAAKDARKAPQMLIVAGTSLKVLGIKRLVKDLAASVHAGGGITLFVNKTSISKSEWGRVFDYHIVGDTDSWVQNLKQNVPDLFRIQTKLKVERRRKPLERSPADAAATLPLHKTEVVKESPAIKVEHKSVVPVKTEPKCEPESKGPLPLLAKRSKSETERAEPRPGVVFAKKTKSMTADTADANLVPLPPMRVCVSQTSASRFYSNSSYERAEMPGSPAIGELSQTSSQDYGLVDIAPLSDPLTDPPTDPLTDPTTDTLTDTDSELRSDFEGDSECRDRSVISQVASIRRFELAGCTPVNDAHQSPT